MTLITKNDKIKLLKNGQRTEGDNVPPVVRLFNEEKGITWLIYKSNPENEDEIFAFHGKNMCQPHVQTASLRELENGRIKLERDRKFKASYKMNIYIEAAEMLDELTEAEFILAFIANETKNLNPNVDL